MMFSLRAVTIRSLALIAAAALLAASPLVAAEDTEPQAPPPQDWSFDGPTGIFDRAALQRGYQVYREVCASCHSMKFVAFRNLADPGGPEFSVDAVEALAAEFTIEDGPDEFGDMFEREGKPSDYFPSPYRNDNEARASNGGALPPDLSVIVKARPNGADYVFALLTGYEDPPADFNLADGMNYNPYFNGRRIAMAPQLTEGIVEYMDGTDATVDRMARDVVQFLTWAAEPRMEERKALAKPVLIYLVLIAILLYMSYKRIWRDVEHG